jgi:uncharacterized protein YqhQ
LVAGLAYEVLKLAAASDKLWARIIRAPGLGLQYLTTREPDADMIAVAIKAFNLAMSGGKSDAAFGEELEAREEQPDGDIAEEPDAT